MKCSEDARPPGFTEEPQDQREEEEDEEGGVAWSDVAMIVFVTGMLLLNVTGLFPTIFGIDTALIVTLVGGYGIFWDSITRLLRGNVGGDLAVTIAAAAALAIGQYTAAAEVVLIMLIGTALEGYVVGRTRSAIAALLELAPSTATVLRDGKEQILPVEQIVSGDRIRIRPGERLPVDGSVLAGQSAVDQAALTGEPLPVTRGPGDRVYAGTINTLGLLEVEAEQIGPETALAQIIRLVEQAEARKAPVQRAASRWAAYFVPTIVVFGLLTFCVWFLFLRAPIEVALTRMAASLIIACPCALILATPTGMAAAIGRCARRGILTRGGVYLETLTRVNCVVFDKTGTLTQGAPQVTDVLGVNGHSRDEVLRIAALAEQGSAHPIAGAVLHAHRNGALTPLESAELRPGLGMEAWHRGHRILVGNRQLLSDAKMPPPAELDRAAVERESRGQTVVFVAAQQELIGLIAIEDRVRPECAAVVSGLRALGIERIVMLTGDAVPAASAVARSAGITEVEAGLFPADKAAHIAALQAEGYCVAMVGDGINDAPSLVGADVGIAMGNGGSHIAVDAADIVFVNNDLARLPEAILISRSALRTIRRNIVWFAIGLNGVSVIASATGLLALLGYRLQALVPALFGGAAPHDISPVLAAVEHQIASLLVVTSSLRLLGGRPAWTPGFVPAPRDSLRGAGWPAGRPVFELAAAVAGIPVFQSIVSLPRRLAAAAHARRRTLVRLLATVLPIGWLLSGLYRTPVGHLAVLQRFGRLVAAEIPPGLHCCAPWPIDRISLVNVGSIRRAEIGFRTPQSPAAMGTRRAARMPGGSEPGASEWSTQHQGNMERIADESVMLTGDEYFVDVNLVIQYQVASAADFLFHAADAENTLRQAGEAALRRAAGRTPLETLLTVARGPLEAEILREAQAVCDRYGVGLHVTAARLTEIHPPQEVVAAYRDVSSALEERTTAINQAEAYSRETIPTARGQAAQNVAAAFGYTFDRIHRASGESARFLQLIGGYQAGREVNTTRLYLETVEQALAPTVKYILDPAGGGRRQMWLQESQIPGIPGLPGVAKRPPMPAPEDARD